MILILVLLFCICHKVLYLVCERAAGSPLQLQYDLAVAPLLSAQSDGILSEEDIALELADSTPSSIPEESPAAVSRPAESVAESVSEYSMAFESAGFRSPAQGLKSPLGLLWSPAPGSCSAVAVLLWYWS